MMLNNWSDHVAYLAGEAERDLSACCDQVHACLVAFGGEDGLLGIPRPPVTLPGVELDQVAGTRSGVEQDTQPGVGEDALHEVLH
jgi:hypothetical protein